MSTGKIKQMIDKIILERSKGNGLIANSTKTKMILKGIYPDDFTLHSPDDPKIIEKVKQIAAEFNVRL